MCWQTTLDHASAVQSFKFLVVARLRENEISVDDLTIEVGDLKTLDGEYNIARAFIFNAAGKSMVGSVMWRPLPNAGLELGESITKEGYRGVGINSLLVAGILDAYPGCRRVEAVLTKDNLAAFEIALVYGEQVDEETRRELAAHMMQTAAMRERIDRKVDELVAQSRLSDDRRVFRARQASAAGLHTPFGRTLLGLGFSRLTYLRLTQGEMRSVAITLARPN
jgi:hypothetical protein